MSDDGFPFMVRLAALIAGQRCCCLCHQRKHTKIVCHHIEQKADGGPNTLENCIPLCPDCHAEVKAFDPRHPAGCTSYSNQELVRRRDDWYAAIKGRATQAVALLHRDPKNYPHSKLLSGRASFDYSSYDGHYRLGDGNSEFLTHWSKAGTTGIYVYSDNTNVSVALAPNGSKLEDIQEVSALDYTSRVRMVPLGNFAVLENHCSRYCAIKIMKIQDTAFGHPSDLLVFDYWILEQGTDDFSV